jgi:hypothetical protein
MQSDRLLAASAFNANVLGVMSSDFFNVQTHFDTLSQSGMQRVRLP